MTNENQPAKITALEKRKTADDARMFSPSVARNKDPILEVLRPHLNPGARILEIASGTGEHGAHIMSSVPGLIWQPSDLSDGARVSIRAWADHSGNEDFLQPVALNATAADWPVPPGRAFDGILCINMIHIAPFEAALGVLKGAGERLVAGGFLFFYGPFKRNGTHTAPSNEAFDASLKSRDASWGIRDKDEIAEIAAKNGLTLERETEMPANNLSLLFRGKS